MKSLFNNFQNFRKIYTKNPFFFGKINDERASSVIDGQLFTTIITMKKPVIFFSQVKLKLSFFHKNMNKNVNSCHPSSFPRPPQGKRNSECLKPLEVITVNLPIASQFDTIVVVEEVKSGWLFGKLCPEFGVKQLDFFEILLGCTVLANCKELWREKKTLNTE